MTLILTLGNKDEVVQFADRRLSRNGRPINEESTKCGIIFSPIARLAFGYTGIGGFGSFQTMDWLVKAISEAGPPDYDILHVLDRLRDNATDTFRRHPALARALPSNKVLSVMFSGFVYGSGQALPGYAFLSNYVDFNTGHRYAEVQDQFRLFTFTQNAGVERNRSGFVQRVGNWAGITERDITQLRDTMHRSPHRSEVANLGVRFIRELATKAASQGSIGKQIESIHIPSDLAANVECSYHTDVVRRSTHMPAQIWLFADRNLAISNIRVVPVEPDTPPISVPKVSKNTPCPCGSKLRYKNCHGKKNPSSAPLTFQVTPS
jgi:hypothetical protein